MNQKLKRKSEKVVHLQEKVNEFEKKETEKKYSRVEKGVQCNVLKSYIEDLKKEIDALNAERDENDDMKESSEFVHIEKNVDFREKSKGRPFNFKLRKLYYFFISNNIGVQHISPVVEAVLNIFDIHVKNLPSKSTTAVLSSEMGVLSRNHVKEELLNSKNITMHRDATTKKGKHFYGLQFNTGNQFLTAGIREVPDGKGETYVNSTKEMLSDISEKESDKKSILESVSCFMTDRSSTEQKVNFILSSEISHDVHSFKCSVHPLLQFSDVCLQEFYNIEKELNIHFDGHSSTPKDPYVMFILRSVSKFFFQDGVGDPKFSRVFLKSHGTDKLPVMNVRGNRFNLCFYNAAGTFFMHQLLLQYLLSSRSSFNVVLNAIVTSLQSKVFLTILRALGFICKFITEPYWQKTLELWNITSINTVYQRLLYVLNVIHKNPSALLKREIKLFEGPDFYDPVSDFLCSMSLNDDLTCVFIKRCISVLIDKAKKLFADFLEGGKYFNSCSTEFFKECSSCSTNNITIERLMGQLDFKLKYAATSSVNTIESILMYNNNKTKKWLEKKSENEQRNIVNTARKDSRAFLIESKRRKEELFNKHLQTIKEKEEENKKKKERKNDAIDKALDDIHRHGLWASETEINEKLCILKTKKEKMTALKTQINIYKKVFKVEQEFRHLLCFSKKGKVFDEKQLKENLITLLKKRKEYQESIACNTNPRDFVSRQILHTWTDNGEDIEWEGQILSYSNGVFKVKSF
ncbi:uncharacterized protein LOC134283186 [Saccostrea cucullata]|uniref:uncharacterized protein LOC134283186 n=1 Tax=Saccostrea cuccullata TaxID=36930 RepID=UPI002ED03CC5